MTTNNLFAIPEADTPEEEGIFTLDDEEIDYTALEEQELAAAALGLTSAHPDASPFERKHRQRQEQASGFNADLWRVLETLLQDRKAQALAANACKALKLQSTVIAEEVRGFTPLAITLGHQVLASIVHKTMRPVQVAELVWTIAGMETARDNRLQEGKDAITPLITYLIKSGVLDLTPAPRGGQATYSLTKRLELAKLAADTLPVSGVILFLDTAGKVYPLPTPEEIESGAAMPEIVLSENEGYVTCTTTGTELPCGLSRWLGEPFISPDSDTIEQLYQDYLDNRAKELENAAGNEEMLRALQEEREPSYWDTLRNYPQHAMTTLIAKDDRGRLLIQSDIGQHMVKEVRQHLTFLDGSPMVAADGKAFVLSLTAALVGNCPPSVAEQLNLAPRLDGKTMPMLLQDALNRAEGLNTPATTGHRDPYGSVWTYFPNPLKRALGAVGANPREVVKKGVTPAGYGSGQPNVARILAAKFNVDRQLGLETAKTIASYPPLADALKITRKATRPCNSFTGSVDFNYRWEDEHGDTHQFRCQTSTVIDNNYIGREWRFNEMLMLRTGETNLSKARTALLANINQGIEAWLLECQAQFAAHLGVALWSTHDQTSTKSEYWTRLITGISATALNAIIAQNMDNMADCWGLKLPRRTHAPYDENTPLYVFDNEDGK